MDRKNQESNYPSRTGMAEQSNSSQFEEDGTQTFDIHDPVLSAVNFSTSKFEENINFCKVQKIFLLFNLRS